VNGESVLKIGLDDFFGVGAMLCSSVALRLNTMEFHGCFAILKCARCVLEADNDHIQRIRNDSTSLCRGALNKNVD
jgi:hypothetical protein